MSKATKFTYLLAAWVTLVFGSAMVMTFASEWLQQSGFFGDIPTRPWQIGNIIYTRDGVVDQGHEWGARHYWYYWLCFVLFSLSIVRIIIWAFNYWENSSKTP